MVLPLPTSLITFAYLTINPFSLDKLIQREFSKGFKQEFKNLGVKGEQMKARTLVVGMYLVNFVVGVFSSLYLLTSLWNHIERWQVAHYVYYTVLALCGVVLSLWLATDGRYLERCTVKLHDLEGKILDFEKRINNIKTRVRTKS